MINPINIFFQLHNKSSSFKKTWQKKSIISSNKEPEIDWTELNSLKVITHTHGYFKKIMILVTICIKTPRRKPFKRWMDLNGNMKEKYEDFLTNIQF